MQLWFAIICHVKQAFKPANWSLEGGGGEERRSTWLGMLQTNGASWFLDLTHLHLEAPSITCSPMVKKLQSAIAATISTFFFGRNRFLFGDGIFSYSGIIPQSQNMRVQADWSI